MSQKTGSYFVLTFCAVSLLGTSLWYFKEESFYVSVLVLLAILAELKSMGRRPSVKARVIVCSLMSALAVVLNTGFVSGGRWRATIIATLFIGALVLTVGDLIRRRLGTRSGDI